MPPTARIFVLAIVLMALTVPANALAAPAINRPYADLVRRVGSALGVSARLIHAVIASESSYDPLARSHAGALGLMQLIPGSGAREAYRWLYGRDRIPTDESLLRSVSGSVPPTSGSWPIGTSLGSTIGRCGCVRSSSPTTGGQRGCWRGSSRSAGN